MANPEHLGALSIRIVRERDERERDERERRLRAEMERLEAVVRSMRAAIDEEREGEGRKQAREGRDGSPQCHAD